MPNRPQADSEAVEAVVGSDGIRNSFEAVPDAPVSKFVLEMVADFTGQNGKVHDTEPALKADCGAKARRHHRRARR